MDKIEELVNKINELASEIERLKEENKNEVWKPKDGEWYWMISHTGFVAERRWTGDSYDDDRYKIGNVFKTKEEAEFRVEQLKVEAELRRFGRKFVPKRGNYYFQYAHQQDSLFITSVWSDQGNDIYFETVEIAQKAIDTVGTERIKKYYFGVEEYD